MRVIAAFSGPCASDDLTSRVSVFSHDFKSLERFPKLATSSLQCYVEWQIERRLRDGTLPTSPKTETQWVPVKEIDLLAILLMGKLYHEEVEGACKHEPPGAQILEP